jgi:DNA-binding transcriptional ArsR family regulator
MVGSKSELPSRIELLSKELVVAREIYAAKATKDSEPMFFNRLVEILEKKHLASRATVSKSLDMLFDQGIVRADWMKRGDGKYVRALTIAGEAQKFVEAIYKHTPE